jgi:hypothetical protein
LNPYINQRILPITAWITITTLSLIVYIPRIFGKEKQPIHNKKNTSLVLILLLLVVIFGFISQTEIGLHTKDVTVNDLGIPLLEWQILYVCGLLIFLFLIQTAFFALHKKKGITDVWYAKYFPFIIFIVLWVAAFIVWVNLPLPNSNYFAPEKLPPNYETYPFSDAERYGLDAQRIITGAIEDRVISKPLHTVYLAFIHSIAGLDYARVITTQMVILALFPAVLYLIGRDVHGSILGIGMSLFAIFREINAIQASDFANVSTTQLLMSDFPSMLILAVLILVNIRWVKNPSNKTSAVLQGGILGMLILYRAQYLILLPLILLMAFFLYNKKWKSILLFSSLFFLCLCVVILPILIRNYSISGSFWFDSPQSLSYFRDFYMLSGDNGEVSPSQIKQTPSSGLIHFILKSDYPLDVVDNLFRNLISTFLIFPIRYDGIQTLRELSTLDANFWAEAYSYDLPSHLIIALINLLILAFGFYAMRENNSKVGYALIAFYFLVNISASLFRFSGWRFIMPVDWLIYAIFLIGILDIADYKTIFRQNETAVEINSRTYVLNRKDLKSNLIIMALFLFVGSLIPLRILIPTSYVQRDKNELCADLDALIIDENIHNIATDLCLKDDIIAIEGKVIHPRFFRKGWGFYDRPEDIYFGEQEFSRLVFRLLDENIRLMYILIDHLPDDTYLPNGANAIILAEKEAYPQAKILVLTGTENSFVYADDFLLSEGSYVNQN